MKDRTVWILLVALALVAGGIYLLRSRPSRAPVAGQVPPAAPVARQVSAEPTVRAGRTGPAVPVQDGKTVDLSTGRPLVRDDAESRAAIERAKKEMAEAAAQVQFTPTPVPAPKKADPTAKP